MEKETTISLIITIIISLAIIALTSLINIRDNLVSWIILIAGIVLIFIIVSIDSINENKKDIIKLNSQLEKTKKDLNISERLSKLEAYFEYLKMEKKGQAIDLLNLIKIAAIIILGYIIIKAILSQI